MALFPLIPKGPCEVVWGYGESAAMYLGETLGATKVTMNTETSPINSEQKGNAPIDAVFLGSIVEVEIPLTRSTMEVLNEVLLAGGVEASGDHQMLPIKNAVGCSLYDLSKSLVFKPLCGGVVDDDPATWVLIHKACPIPAMDLTYDKGDTQRIYPVKFMCFVSHESGEDNEYGYLGMESGSTEYGY